MASITRSGFHMARSYLAFVDRWFMGRLYQDAKESDPPSWPGWRGLRMTDQSCRARKRNLALRGDAGTDRAAHAGAAEAAITPRILRQILLVIILSEIERRRV